MRISFAKIPISELTEYARVPIAFEVDRVFDVEQQAAAPSGFALVQRKIDVPYVKDYDAIDGGPRRWAERFDMSNWWLIRARSWESGEHVGGMAIAIDTPGLDMLEGRTDLAVLWDIRVAPEFRGRGIGYVLFSMAKRLARERGCRQLKVETQNINVAACRFYERQRCVLRKVRRLAYPEFPEEVQLLWYKDLLGKRDSAEEVSV